MGYARDALGMRSGYARDTLGIRSGYARDTLGMRSGYARDTGSAGRRGKPAPRGLRGLALDPPGCTDINMHDAR
jgi:hypothetical protein